MSTPTLSPGAAAGVAAAGALLPLAGPNGQIAAALLAEGLKFWGDYAARMADGTLTVADAQAAADKLGGSMAELAKNISAMPE